MDSTPAITQLVTQLVSAALDSGLNPDEVIACFGLSAKLILAGKGADAITCDPYVSFGKGLAQLPDVAVPDALRN